MTDLNYLYSEIKFWLPLLTGFGMVVKAYLSGKKGVSEWASSLLDNHLHSIETATKSTEFETRRTNTLLTEAATREIATSGKYHESRMRDSDASLQTEQDGSKVFRAGARPFGYT